MNLVDSSGWIEFLTDGSGADFFAEPLRDPSRLVVPTVCITEVTRFLLRVGSESEAIQVAAAMQQGRVVPLDGPLAILAARTGADHRLPLADSMVYATARHLDAIVWTQDSDFEGLPGVRYRPKV